MNKLDTNSDLYKIRHSLAHVLAQAVLEIRPGAKLGFGPPVDNGFYYDFDLEEPLTPEDLPKLVKDLMLNQQAKFQKIAFHLILWQEPIGKVLKKTT